MLQKIIQNQLVTLIGIVVGASAGYLYWNWVGCSAGTCAITSNPVNSSLYGALMGGILFSLFKPSPKK